MSKIAWHNLPAAVFEQLVGMVGASKLVRQEGLQILTIRVSDEKAAMALFREHCERQLDPDQSILWTLKLEDYTVEEALGLSHASHYDVAGWRRRCKAFFGDESINGSIEPCNSEDPFVFMEKLEPGSLLRARFDFHVLIFEI